MTVGADENGERSGAAGIIMPGGGLGNVGIWVIIGFWKPIGLGLNGIGVAIWLWRPGKKGVCGRCCCKVNGANGMAQRIGWSGAAIGTNGCSELSKF